MKRYTGDNIKCAHLEFKVNTPGLIKEIVELSGPKGLPGVLKVPVEIFRDYLVQIAERAAQLNDDKLNAIMCQMALYEIANPESKDFDRERVHDIISKKYNNK